MLSHTQAKVFLECYNNITPQPKEIIMKVPLTEQQRKLLKKKQIQLQERIFEKLREQQRRANNG
jgi:uncharacterized membrane protein